jgi:hypothetical protein
MGPVDWRPLVEELRRLQRQEAIVQRQVIETEKLLKDQRIDLERVDKAVRKLKEYLWAKYEMDPSEKDLRLALDQPLNEDAIPF